MSDKRFIIGKNIAELRKSHGMTQLELAEKLNYSDKAISKWERGEVTTDILVLKEVADLFGVSLDYFFEEEHPKQSEPVQTVKGKLHNRGIITGISMIVVLLIATLAFVISDMIVKGNHATWLAFVYAVPLTMIVWLVFNSIWFKKHRNFLIVSLLMWTTIAAAFITALLFNQVLWKLFILGAPGQIIIILWSYIKGKKN